MHAGPAAEQVMLLENIGTSVLVSDNQVPMSLLKLILIFSIFLSSNGQKCTHPVCTTELCHSCVEVVSYHGL